MMYRFFFICGCLLLCASSARALNEIVIRDIKGVVRAAGDIGESRDGSVTIRVADDQGDLPVDGTRCRLTSIDGRTVISALSQRGEASFEGVPAGEYLLTVEGGNVSIVKPRE